MERIKISLKKKYSAYQKSDSKIKLEDDIASKQVKLEELKISLKNTKVFFKNFLSPKKNHLLLCLDYAPILYSYITIEMGTLSV